MNEITFFPSKALPKLVSAASLQGKRKSMEDMLCVAKYKSWWWYAVMDGHGGRVIARKVRKRLPKLVFLRISRATDVSPRAIMDLLRKCFLDLDARLYKTSKKEGLEQGCTCCAILRQGHRVWVANLGDSRTLGITMEPDGTIVRCIKTADHKPGKKAEHRRILKAGGRVTKASVPRVNGTLSLSRAFGDFDLKPKEYSGTTGPISACPRIYFRTISDGKARVFIIACDGIWDVLSSRKVTDIVRQNGPTVARTIADAALDAGSTDNLSVIVVRMQAAAKKRASTSLRGARAK